MCKINTPVYLYMYEVDKLKHYGAVQMSGQCKKMISISYLGKKNWEDADWNNYSYTMSK